VHRPRRPGRLKPAPTDLAAWIDEAVKLYQALAKRYRDELRRID
jgi:hypothetical protein